MKLELNGVKFSYTSVPVLENVSLVLDGPQFVSILGPNGVGKSTLIQCINKILEPTGGSILIDGTDVKDMPQKEVAKTVGYVPYSANDTFPLTVVDTVLMGRHPHSNWRSLDFDLDKVYEALKMLDIEELAMRSFNELSAGQHQKVMLARGLVQEPKIILLDEPTSNLDIKHQIDVTQLLKEISQEKGVIVIMICHDINIAAKYSDKIVLMYEGIIFDVGTPDEVITPENLRTVYKVESRIIDDCGRPHVILGNTIHGPKGAERASSDIPVESIGSPETVSSKIA